MDFTHRLSISYYKTIAVINKEHNIDLVQHQETGKFFVKKVLDVFNIHIYERLYSQPVTGTPNIVDYVEESGQLTVIEEFIAGVSLRDRLKQKDLSMSDIMNYMQDLCMILNSLHSGTPAIIHRDIKPSNIIITHYNRAILLDFNAAKYYSDQTTEDTVLLGTQGYAAPEQYGFGSSSPQTDIYALGILFKEMLQSIDYASARTEYIISKCTQMSPSERYRSMRELYNDLSTLIKPERRNITPNYFTKYAPPGFRSKTPWKMLNASIIYLFITWLCFSLDIKNTYGAVLQLQRIAVFAMMLSIVFGTFNYLDIQKAMPLCQHKNRFLRYVGIALLDIALVFGLLILLFIILMTFFSDKMI